MRYALFFVPIFMEGEIKEQWSIGKIKAELSKAKYVPYKGRTRYYEMVAKMLKEY